MLRNVVRGLFKILAGIFSFLFKKRDDANQVIERLQMEQCVANATEAKEEQLARIREVQTLLCSDKSETPNETVTGAALVIGVNATPKTFAGYCVNLRDRWIEYYVIGQDKFPWLLKSNYDAADLKMKNLLFALFNWSDKIGEFKTFSFYLDCYEVYGNSQIAMDVQDYLQHLTECEGKGVKFVNEGKNHINRIKDLHGFASFIQPADDLSRWDIKEAENFLCNFYRISKKGIHGNLELMHKGESPWYEVEKTFDVNLKAVKQLTKDFKCYNCEVSVSKTILQKAKTRISMLLHALRTFQVTLFLRCIQRCTASRP